MHAPAQRRTFLQKHLVKLGVVGALVFIGGAIALMPHSSSPHRHESDLVLLAPPPPPPPPPPPKPPPPKKMVEQTPVDKPEPKPQNPDQPKSAPTGPTTLGGHSSFKMGSGDGGGGGGGSRWGWYASSVQNSIHQALVDNPTTHHAAIGVTVRIWPDFTGRITRVQLVNSTGNPSLDDAIKNQVLNGLALPGAPPDGMPLPINLRINARP